MVNTLSGRFLLLTILFVMLAEVLIFVPSAARFREDYLLARLDRAQIASLALLADGRIGGELEAELLRNAEVYNVVLRRDSMRQLVLSSPLPEPISATYDLRDASAFTLIRDALARLATPGNAVIRVIGHPTRDAGQLIEVTMNTAPLRAEMLDYVWRILLLSAFISIITAGLLFVAVRRLMVTPIRKLVAHMMRYAEAPEDARNIIAPSGSIREVRAAEESLHALQQQLTGALRQKERLAQLGGAVAKISHDLRNILSTAQLFADRMERSADPQVQRAAPKLVNSLRRAVALCEGALAFGKAEEPPPLLGQHPLSALVEDVLESEALAASPDCVSFVNEVPGDIVVRCDADQLHRVLGNLVRNARQAIEATGVPGEVRIAAQADAASWRIEVSDTGPGLPPKAQEHLFAPFRGSFRRDGIGLGLVIAQELVRGHGGRLDLVETGSGGTVFVLTLPRGEVSATAA